MTSVLAVLGRGFALGCVAGAGRTAGSLGPVPGAGRPQRGGRVTQSWGTLSQEGGGGKGSVNSVPRAVGAWWGAGEGAVGNDKFMVTDRPANGRKGQERVVQGLDGGGGATSGDTGET